MPVRHGRNWSVYANGVDISGDLNAVNINSEQELIDVSAFGHVGHTFYPGLTKDTGTIESLYNSTGAAVFAALRQQTTGYALMLPVGTALGNNAYVANEVMLSANNVKAVVTDVVRATIGVQTTNIPFVPGVMLTAGIQTVAAASTGQGSAVSNGSASATTGGAAYLQTFARTAGGTLTVSVQQSTTGAFAGEQATTCTFAASSTAETQRVAITAQITQYARAAWVGATSTSYFALCLVRY
jgi:hypothetical protein